MSAQVEDTMIDKTPHEQKLIWSNHQTQQIIWAIKQPGLKVSFGGLLSISFSDVTVVRFRQTRYEEPGHQPDPAPI